MRNFVAGCLTRRRLFSGGCTGVATLLLAACGASPKAAHSTVAGSTQGSGRGTVTPSGLLRLGIGVHFPPNLDYTRSGYEMTFLGMTEALTRVTPAGKLEPWLAAGVENVDPSTWRIRLRANAKFWDGAPVDAVAVIAAFHYNWEQQPGADGLISKQSTLTAIDPMTVELRTPQPAGNIPYALATQYFIIGRPGQNGSILTSAYRPTQFQTDQQLTMEPFLDHWSGAPPISRITVRNQPDGEARVLALQSGDLDMVWGLPPEAVKALTGDLQATVTTSTRVHLTILNVARPLFGDASMRKAISMSIDRAALVKLAMDGQGTPAIGLFPPNAGVDAVTMQTTDTSGAKQLLQQIGWQPGSDGVRVKDGKRLAFTLYTSPSRPEITPIAVAMQDQLKQAGYDLNVQQVQDISIPMKSGDWDAAMSSINTLVTGDPLYMLDYLLQTNTYIYGGYSNPQYAAVVDQLRAEPDPSKREAISHQAQMILKDDVPYLFLVNPPIITGLNKKKVRNFVPHPNDLYFINTDISVSA